MFGAVVTNKRRLLIGNDSKTLDLVQCILPTGYQRITAFATKFSKKLEPK